jgi:glutaminyl-tRNA synthetase
MTHLPGRDFIRQIIDSDVKNASDDFKVITRFPPEPNGFLHIGHAKSICLNFGVASEHHGKTYLRFDDTNPGHESQEYAEAIKEDVKWLGFDWKDNLTHASDYFEQLYDVAELLIKNGSAYVDSLSTEDIRKYRGTLTQPGKNSPYRDRRIEENLELFHRMRQGEFSDGEHILRAKIDMNAPNINMRDPAIYRIRHINHQRTKDKWCIYPMYDFAHCLSDAFEDVSHSLCTLEFEDHRPLYDWFISQVKPKHIPKQIEFSRLNVAYSLTSKRKLNQLVEKGVVNGWDDPRLPTIAGMRRRGYPPQAIVDFCHRVGITKKDNVIEMSVLEHSVREKLDESSARRMVVLRPLKVILTNFDESKDEILTAKNHPNRTEFGERKISFAKELYIERDDFMEDAPEKFFRLKPGGEVRLRYAYIIRCDEVIKNSDGEIIELHCSYDPDTRSGTGTSDKKVKGTIHWVSVKHSFSAEIRLYDRLFSESDPGTSDDIMLTINPKSLEVVSARLENSLLKTKPGETFQFERNGYFCSDRKDYNSDAPIYNRIITLRDSWAKIEKQARNQQ